MKLSLMMRNAWRVRKRVRVYKFRLRIAENGLDRDLIGAINIGLKYLNTNSMLMALASTEPVVEANDATLRASPDHGFKSIEK